MPFGTELVRYAVGIGSCGVPGLPAGLDALWSAHGRLPWAQLVEPALRLASGAVPMPAAHASCLAMLATVMTMNEGAEIYAPGGSLLEEGDLLRQPGLVRALEAIADEGPRSAYEGAIGRSLLRLIEDRGGLVTEDDLRAYEAIWSEPVAVEFRGFELRTRAGLSDFPSALGALPELRGLGQAERALALVTALAADIPDPAGNDEPHGAGRRRQRVRADDEPGPRLRRLPPRPRSPPEQHARGGRPADRASRARRADGEHDGARRSPSTGSESRSQPEQRAAPVCAARCFRSSPGILDEGLDPQTAVERPRLHPAGALVHLEPGFDTETTGALESAGFDVREWPGRHHYFGGVSAVTRNGAAGDPRRSGAARLV